MPIRTDTFRSHVKKLRHYQTPAEQKLWLLLRSRSLAGFKFRRQHPILDYIADFCCLRARLVIEVDSDCHLERPKADRARAAALNGEGYRVLRFSNYEVLNETEQVISVILNAMKPSPPAPSPQKGEGK
jgi:adenine-specific DNA-methyltransferase